MKRLLFFYIRCRASRRFLSHAMSEPNLFSYAVSLLTLIKRLMA